MSTTVAAICIAAGPLHAQDNFQLQAGDSLIVSILGIPELTTTAIIDVSGAISLPLLGRVQAGGKTIQEVDQELRRLYPFTSFRARIDGEEHVLAINPSDVFVRINAWRAVYVIGPVQQPGARPYRPGMTVREAIAEVGKFQAPEDISSYIRLEAELDSARAEYVTALGREVRLKAAQTEFGDIAPLPDSFLDDDYAQEVWVAEAAQLQRSRDRLSAEIRYFEKALDAARRRLGRLEQLNEVEVQSLNRAKALLERQQELEERGLVPADRLNDAALQVAQATTRTLEIQTTIVEADQQLIDLNRQRERVQEAETDRLAVDLIGSKRELIAAQIRLATVERTLLVLGNLPDTDGGIVSAEYEVTRMSVSLLVDLDTVLHPGDVLSVRLLDDVD